jgi:transcriptional regulator with XRE-family HTH domain
METIGSRIRWARGQKGWTQEDLSEEIHMERTMVSRWERDEAVPRGGTRLKLANALGVSTEWLRTGEGPNAPPEPLPLLDPPPPGASFIPAAWLLIKEVLRARKISLEEDALSDLFVSVAFRCLQENRPATAEDVTQALIQIINGK